jgi:large subunit ribosomal protein L10
MSMNLEQKKAIVSEVAEVAASAPVAIAAEYSGLSVAELTQLRRTARSAGVYIKVVRNTLARKALSGTKFECMRESLHGPLLLAFSGAEPGSAAKVFRDFSKSNEKLVVKLIALDGKLLSALDLERVANIPTLETARSMLLGLMQAPMSKFLRLLSEPEAKFMRLLAARRDQQQTAA